MTQSTDITLANQSGANYRTEDNSINQAFGSTHKGSTAPSYAVTGMHWIDDSGTPWIEKVYDGSDWISIYEINATSNTIRVINQADGAVRTGAANIGQIQDSKFTWLGTSTGTNTLTASLTPAITAYVTGGVYRFIVGTTNTGAVTLNINSVGAKNVQFQGAALAANSLIAGDVITVVYDGTQFQVISPVGGTEGDILYYNASNQLTRLPKGTDGQVLNLASGLPAWTDTSGGGMGVLLGSYTASNDTGVDIGSGLDLDAAIDGTYDVYVIQFLDIIPQTDSATFAMRTSTNTGVSFDNGASDYQYSQILNRVSNNTPSGSSSAGDSLLNIFTQSMGNDEGESVSGVVSISNPSGSSVYSIIRWQIGGVTSSNEIANYYGHGCRNSATAIDAFRFLQSTGNITSGKFYLYGIKKA